MSMDRLSNMLSSLKNAALANKPFVELPYTKECEEVAKNLKKAGFLDNVKVFKDSEKSYKMLHLDISFEAGVPKITDVSRISKPGRRIYAAYKEIRKVAGGYGLLVVSTSRGIMSGADARKKKLGGELICSVK